jgi:hypothetical protein
MPRKNEAAAGCFRQSCRAHTGVEHLRQMIRKVANATEGILILDLDLDDGGRSSQARALTPIELRTQQSALAGTQYSTQHCGMFS